MLGCFFFPLTPRQKAGNAYRHGLPGARPAGAALASLLRPLPGRGAADGTVRVVRGARPCPRAYGRGRAAGKRSAFGEKPLARTGDPLSAGRRVSHTRSAKAPRRQAAERAAPRLVAGPLAAAPGLLRRGREAARGARQEAAVGAGQARPPSSSGQRGAARPPREMFNRAVSRLSRKRPPSGKRGERSGASRAVAPGPGKRERAGPERFPPVGAVRERAAPPSAGRAGLREHGEGPRLRRLGRSACGELRAREGRAGCEPPDGGAGGHEAGICRGTAGVRAAAAVFPRKAERGVCQRGGDLRDAPGERSQRCSKSRASPSLPSL